MHNQNVEKVALTFIREKLRQKLNKEKNPQIISAPVGLKTEEAMRNCLNDKFNGKGISVRNKLGLNQRLALTGADFVESGLTNKQSYIKKIGGYWSQCDVYVSKNSTPTIMGEIKTTTSSYPNICGLINKNLTAFRNYKLKPLSIVLYPDIKPSTLRSNHEERVKGLHEKTFITDEEYNALKNCFFILTTIGWKNGLDKRMKSIDAFQQDEIDLVIESNNLLRPDDIDYNEWDRLVNFIGE